MKKIACRRFMHQRRSRGPVLEPLKGGAEDLCCFCLGRGCGRRCGLLIDEDYYASPFRHFSLASAIPRAAPLRSYRKIAFPSGTRGTVVLFMALMMLVLSAVTYAQVIWAQIALAILIIVGPIFIPFLVFEPMAFLFWGWFRAMITYSLYAVIAGAVLRVFSAVGIAFITSMGQADLNFTSLMDVGLWMLAVVPFFIAGILASLKIGELASMLVTGGGAGGSGLMGMVSTAGMAVAGGGTAAAAKVGAGGMK